MDIKPKPYHETLMTCASILVVGVNLFWFLPLYMVLMRGYGLSSILMRTFSLSGPTILILAPIMTWFLRDVSVQIDTPSRQEADDRLVALLFSLGYSRRSGTDNVAVFEYQRGFGPFRWPIGVAFGDRASTVVGPAATVKLLVKRYNGKAQ